jgi:hypothetical protein
VASTSFLSPPLHFFHTITGKNKTMQPVEKTILAIQFEFLPGKMLLTKITEANKEVIGYQFYNRRTQSIKKDIWQPK